MAVKLVIISPEADDPRESAALGDLFAAGLERYHVRKPAWPREKLEAWLRALPSEWRRRIVLHSHHDLVAALGLGGWHFRDEVGRVIPNPPPQDLPTATARRVGDNAPYLSRSCHDLASLRSALSHYDSVFFSPVFPSLSKPGHGPRADFPFAALAAILATRTEPERRTAVLALGGITAETAPRALALGFDGVAVLGAIWQAADPARAFVEIQNSIACHAA
jgi:thiamine-phosphate pyrophosphorylase